jgi:hypothetical protein
VTKTGIYFLRHVSIPFFLTCIIFFFVSSFSWLKGYITIAPEGGIKEATQVFDPTTAILRKPGDRWQFARAIDEKFNQPRYRAKFEKGRTYQSNSELVPLNLEKQKEKRKEVNSLSFFSFPFLFFPPFLSFPILSFPLSSICRSR